MKDTYTDITINIAEKIKDQAQEIFSEIGIDMTTAIEIYFRQVIRHKGLPFNLTPNDSVEALMENLNS